MTCYLCKNKNIKRVHKGTRDNSDIDVMRCPNCSLVFLSHMDHITNELYEDNGQAKSTADIEINAYNFDTTKRLQDYAGALAAKTVLDYGCGRGAFATKLKNDGITRDIYTLEPNLAYKPFLAKHFNHLDQLSDAKDNTFDYITLFHVLEHIPDPAEILNSFYNKLKKGGKIILEVPHSEDALLTLYGSAAFSDFTYWSLHLYLFNRRTLELLASMTPYKISYIRYYQRYGLTNHLHWLSKEAPGGQNKWYFLNDGAMDKLYENKLAELGLTDTIVMALEK